MYGEQVVYETEGEQLERLARYVVRAPMPFQVVEATAEEQVRITTPPDPRTGEREVVLDPLEFIHAVCRQVPDPRQHLVRYYGIYANRSRKMWQRRWGSAEWGGEASVKVEADSGADGNGPGGCSGARGGSWSRLLRRILEVDPLVCPRCKVEMVVVSVITEPRVVDRILEHVAWSGGDDPFAERAPPAADDAVVVEPLH